MVIEVDYKEMWETAYERAELLCAERDEYWKERCEALTEVASLKAKEEEVEAEVEEQKLTAKLSMDQSEKNMGCKTVHEIHMITCDLIKEQRNRYLTALKEIKGHNCCCHDLPDVDKPCPVCIATAAIGGEE